MTNSSKSWDEFTRIFGFKKEEKQVEKRLRIIKEGGVRLTAEVFQNEVTCMVAEDSHQKTMKTTGRLSFS